MRKGLASLVIVLAAWPAFAGVTIHYEVALSNADDVAALKRAACDIALNNEWSCVDLADQDQGQVLDSITLRFVREIEAGDQPLDGVVIHPHEMSEPVNLVFGPSLIHKNFVKTQFAGPRVHAQIVDMLRKLSPLLRSIEVIDEADYWESGNSRDMEAAFASVDAQIEAIKRDRRDVHGPVKLSDGRILDIVARGER